MKQAVLIVFAVILGTGAVVATEFEISVRSFIPNVHGSNPGYILPVPGHDGLTMIPGPLPINDCFLTDQRGFSTEPSGPGVTSRIAAYAKFDETGAVIDRYFLPSESVEVDCEDGEEECRNPVDTSGGEISDVVLSGGALTITLRGEANNACFGGSPDIDFNVTFVIDPAARTVAHSGTIDEFPSFEALMRVNNGSLTQLFAILPADGSDATGVLSSRPLPDGTGGY